MKRFIVYFLFISTILSKDGLLLAVNSFQKVVDVSVGTDLTLEVLLEEESFEGFWYDINDGSGLFLLPALQKEKSNIAYINSFLLQVHLEHVGPPPKYA